MEFTQIFKFAAVYAIQTAITLIIGIFLVQLISQFF